MLKTCYIFIIIHIKMYLASYSLIFYLPGAAWSCLEEEEEEEEEEEFDQGPGKTLLPAVNSRVWCVLQAGHPALLHCAWPGLTSVLTSGGAIIGKDLGDRSEGLCMRLVGAFDTVVNNS